MQILSFIEHQSDDFSYQYEDVNNFRVNYTAHTHSGWEFLYIKTGLLSYSVDGNVFDIHPGSLIITRPGEIHSLLSDGPLHYERYLVEATEQLLPSNILKQFPADLHVLVLSGNKRIPDLFEKFLYYIENLQAEHLETMLRQMINELFTDIYIASKNPEKSVASQSNAVITKAVNYIKAHIREPLPVQSICDTLFISHSYLNYCFAKHMSVTPKQYIMLQKLQLAQQAMVNADNPTKVCREFGFRNYSTFYRNYQKIYGCRPSDNTQKTLQKIEF